MRFPPSFLDELRMRLRISEVVGRKVNLKSQGRGEFIGLCPFHKEKTPSFTVSDEKNFYHCFGCGAHGDAVRFLTEAYGLSFVDAVTQLTSEAGMSLPKISEIEEQKYEKYDQGYEVLEAACKFFEEQLNLPNGREAREYINKRGLNEKTVLTYRIGYSPENNQLKKALSDKGFTEESLIETGLLVEKENGDNFDRFRNRLMFPISDSKGRIVGFGGRILGEGEPKYLNSPETYLFKKGYIVYGWHLARERAYEKQNIAVVEGYMDVIALHQVGITNVVAPLGTALTENHLRQIWKVAKEPIICMDGDNAGKRAMYRAAINYLPLITPGHSIKFAQVPEGQDPDDVIKNSGVESIREIFANAQTLSDTIWQFEYAQKPIDTPEQKADFQQRLMKLVSSIKDRTVQDFYKKDFNERLWRFGAGKNAKLNKNNLTKLDIPQKDQESDTYRYEKMILNLIFNHHGILTDPEIENNLIETEFTNDHFAAIRDIIIEYFGDENTKKSENFDQYLENSAFNTQINHIKSCKFMESFAKTGAPLEVAKSEWRYLLAMHNLTATEKEYAKALIAFQNEVTEEAQTHLFELQKEIDALKLSITSEKKHREALLEE